VTDPIRLGMLTPSSNTVLEPVTTALVAGLPEVSVHFSRFRVTQISLETQALGQFDDAPMLEAARLLAEAKVHLIAWNGTAAGWLGFEKDERLCAAITAETGLPAVTSVLALNEIFRLTGVRAFALISPYTDDVQARIVENYRAAGIACVAERHLGITDNYAFGEVTATQLDEMARHVTSGARPEAIATYCTNLRAAPLVPGWEKAYGLPVYDTISVVVWKALRTLGLAPSRVRGWGRLFDQVS
jgi:maleate isomerase